MLETSPSDSATTSPQKLCYYCNCTPKVQVGLITNIPGHRVEQVLFPSQRWMFWAVPEAILKIYDSDSLDQDHIQQIPCQSLQVVETDQQH